MSDSAKRFYYILRTPIDPLLAQGLLYSSDSTIYSRLKVFFCDNNTSPVPCMPFNDTNSNPNQVQLANRGRIFLFI